MLRHELIASADHLVTVLEPVHVLLNLFSGAERKNVKPSDVFDVFQRYKKSEAVFTPAEKSILKIWQLDSLGDPGFWAILVGPEQTAGIRATYSNVFSLLKYLPRVARLLSRQPLSRQPQSDTSTTASVSETILTIFLREEESQQSTPERIVSAISGVTDVYRALADINGVASNDLVVLACDSGSDKEFDFLGGAAAISAFKDFFFGLFDRVFFFRHLQYGMRIKQVSETLPVLEKISEMQASGKLEPEKAEILKRQLIGGAVKLLESGATIPEVDAVASYDPGTLLTAKPTLLLEGPTNDTQPTGSGQAKGSHTLSDDEQALLDLLVRKQKGDQNEG